jgi:hypothetical protein
MTTLYELEKSKSRYESQRKVMQERAAHGLVSKIELMEFDIAHLNAFSTLVMGYLHATAGDDR